MPTPEERDAMKAEEEVEISPEIRALLDAARKEIAELRRQEVDPKIVLRLTKQEIADCLSEQCTCTALFTNATCAIHGPAFARHIENRK